MGKEVKEIKEAKNAISKKLSKRGKFMVQSNGYEFFRNGVRIDKWEVVALGYTDMNDILKGDLEVTCKLKSYENN